MNIDYTAIITKANERKDALVQFEEAVRLLRSEINDGNEPDLITAAHLFQTAVNNLDAEAVAMLPGHNLEPVRLFVNNLLSMWAFADKIGGSAFAVQKTPRKALFELAGEKE